MEDDVYRCASPTGPLELELATSSPTRAQPTLVLLSASSPSSLRVFFRRTEEQATRRTVEVSFSLAAVVSL